MSEPSKRVFLPMGDSSDFLKKPEKNAGTGGNKSKTLRLDLELFEPDERTFPEFNYAKLVHIEKKKQKKIAKLPNGNHEDPFGANDDDVERIARELEAKYGSGSSYSKSAKLTTVDRGAGYDASDSFIDDTEAYDELIPDEIETDRGGFYINSGALEFKKLSNYERPGDDIKMPKAKKRALSSSSDSSDSDGAGEGKTTEKVKKKIHTEKKVKTIATSSSDEQGKSKKSKKEKLEKQEKPEKPKEIPAAPVKEPEKKKPEPEKVVKTTTVKDMLRLKRDNLRKQEQGKSASSGGTTASDDDDGESESVSSLAVSESSHDSHPETVAPVNGVKEVTLPDNLPSEVTTLIATLKQTVETNPSSTKLSFLDSRVLDVLVKVDNTTKSIGASVRVQTFSYMASFMPCTKKTLFEKVRRHRHNQIHTKFKVEVNKLRRIVSEAMPALITKYETDMKSYESKKNVQNIVGETNVEIPAPRKKFHWNDVSRKILSNIVSHLEDLQKASKAKKEHVKEYLAQKLKEDVVPLWPDGWIKVEDLQKELEKKKKKDAKVAAAASATQGAPQPQVQTKPITASQSASPKTTNGKTPAQKTETSGKHSEPKLQVNGKATSSVEPSVSAPVLPTSSPASVIKRSSDHSINSIISASPSPPAAKTPDVVKPRVIDLEKLNNPSDLLKGIPPKTSMPRFSNSPIDITTPEKVNPRRSDSSDSDCVEIVTNDFNPLRTEKLPYLNNNNKVNHHTSNSAPIAKKLKKHGSDDGEQETDYSKIIMGLQSLTDPKTSQFLTKNPLSSPVSSAQRKAETSHD